MNKTNLKIEQLIGRKFIMLFLHNDIREVTVEKLSPSGKYCKIVYDDGYRYQWTESEKVLVSIDEFLDE
jgi:hypothetical protein